MGDNEGKIIKDLINAISAHDVEKIGSFFTEECFYEDVADGSTMRGRKEVEAGYHDFFILIPDFKLETTSVFTSGNQVTSEWVMTGTSKSGKYFSIRGVSISKIQEGKINRNLDYYNPALLQ
jgi:steroid delta-isomerase-like uncharacterized protein